jgi:hypothetical protein
MSLFAHPLSDVCARQSSYRVREQNWSGRFTIDWDHFRWCYRAISSAERSGSPRCDLTRTKLLLVWNVRSVENAICRITWSYNSSQVVTLDRGPTLEHIYVRNGGPHFRGTLLSCHCDVADTALLIHNRVLWTRIWNRNDDCKQSKFDDFVCDERAE